MSKKQMKGGSTAPAELLYAMVVATDASIKHPDDEAQSATADGIIELLSVAERLPVPEGKRSLSMQDLITAAIGYIGLEENNPTKADNRIVPDVQTTVLRYASAQKFLSEYVERKFGWRVEFSPQPDAHIIGLTKVSFQQGRENC